LTAEAGSLLISRYTLAAAAAAAAASGVASLTPRMRTNGAARPRAAQLAAGLQHPAGVRSSTPSERK
jgi:hypothetical protein